MRAALPAIAVAAVLCSCMSSSSESATSPTPVEVAVEDLLDPSVDIGEMDQIDSIELGALTPTPDGFCEAFGVAPSRWLDDAIIPLQFWRDAYGAIDDLPMGAEEHLDALWQHSQARFDWNFKGGPRPDFAGATQEHARQLAIIAVDQCPAIPLILGPGADTAPERWAEGLDANAIVGRCAEERSRMQRGIDAYVAQHGTQPGHVEEVEAGLYPGPLPDSGIFFDSQVYGIRLRGKAAQPVALDPGPCAS